MNDTEVSIKFKNSITGEKKLEKYAEQLKIINSVLSGLDAGKIKQLQDSASSIQSMDSNVKDLRNQASAAFDYLKITKFYGAIKKLGAGFASLSKKSMDYLENFNLFQVAFNGNYNSAEKFINKMSEMYGLDESWLTQTVGKFKQLTNAMNLTADTGEKVSKLLTQMSLDISSLYNVDIDKAASTLSSAMAGQTKPIRGVAGADITQTTLQTTLDQIGIDRAVSQLSFAEKRLLIIISLTKQLNASIGDMGRTIESPANQLRILNEQWERLTRAVGNVFLPILTKILPYLNAILMVLTEIINIIASLVGYKRDDFDYFDSAASGAWDLDEGIKSATKSAKKLKQGLRGFDKLNVITTPTSGSTGAGGIGAGGVNANILKEFNKAFDEYQKKFGEVKSKATDIRDSIMEWLGFTKEVNEETDDVSFKFDHITGGTVLGALAVGGVIFRGITTVFGILRKIGLLKFPLIETLFGKIFGGGGAKNALTGAAGLGNAVNDNAKSFKLPSIKTVLTGLAELAIVVAGLTALMTAIGYFMKIPTVKEATTTGIKMIVEVFKGIGKILVPLALVTAGMLAMGSLGGKGVASIALGLADMAIVIVGTEAIMLAVGGLAALVDESVITSGIDLTVKIFEGISKILLPLGILAVGLAAAGLAGGAGVAAIAVGLADMAIVIGGTTAVVAALGILSETKFVKNNLDNGIELVVKLFQGLGRIAGALIGGLISEALKNVGKSLPEFGENLALFMEKASPFFDKVGAINQNVALSISYLADAILKLTAAQVLKGLTNWFSNNISLADFGKELEKFGPSFKNFATEINQLPKSTVEKTKITVEAMLVLIDMAKKIPNAGGLLAAIVGDNTLSEFSKMLPDFAKHFAEYSKRVSGVDSKVVEKTKDVKEAMLQIIEFAKKIPNEGGVAAFFAGDNGIGKFGENLKSFGGSFKAYAENVNKIDLTKLNNVTSAISDIVNNAKKIKDNGLGKTMKDFGESLKSSANDITKFYKTAFTESDGKSAGEKFGKGIVNGIKTALNNGKIKLQLKDSNGNNAGGSYSFKATANYAQGGLPPVGQLFVANERGPELVGQIGGQSFVANQNQVIDLIDKKLGDAKANSINPTFIIQVGSKEIAKQVITDLQDMAKTNGKPIVIGG